MSVENSRLELRAVCVAGRSEMEWAGHEEGKREDHGGEALERCLSYGYLLAPIMAPDVAVACRAGAGGSECWPELVEFGRARDSQSGERFGRPRRRGLMTITFVGGREQRSIEGKRVDSAAQKR